MTKNEYYAKLLPYAKIAEAGTGIEAELITAFWSWETDYGTNESSKLGNNHGGIKANSSGRDYVVGQYAGYNSINRFAEDWARILNVVKGVGYEAVLKTASITKDPVEITKVFNASKYAEQDYNVNVIVDRYNAIKNIKADDKKEDYDNNFLIAVGIAVLAVYNLIKKK